MQAKLLFACYVFGMTGIRDLTRRTTLALAGGGLLTSLAAHPAQAAGSSWEAIAESGVLRIGVLSNHAPYHELEEGTWTGFAVQMGLECMAALGKAMNKALRAEYVLTSLATVILDIQANRLDLYFGLTASPERAQAVRLFGPIYELPECAINGRGFDPGSDWAAYDKPDVSIAVVVGSTDEQAARKLLPHADIRALKSTADAILSVQSGHAQAMINTLLSGMMAKKKLPDLGAPIVLQPLYNQPSDGGTRKDADDRFGVFLDQWAASFRASGRSKQVILEALEHFGLDTGNLPASLHL